MGQKSVKNMAKKRSKMDPKFGKKYPRNVPKKLIPAHFESFFWGLNLANFVLLVNLESFKLPRLYFFYFLLYLTDFIFSHFR